MTAPSNFSEVEDILAETLPGYERRVAQGNLAQGIERFFAHKENFVEYNVQPEDFHDWSRPGIRHFLGEAGCGTGKGLGYLIPAILSGKRVVVSTGTKALQSQLQYKDVPFLQKHLGVKFSWCVLKGRSNYLCVNRLALVTVSDVPDLPAIIEAMKAPGFDGLNDTISDLIGHEVPYASWNLICSDSEECQDNSCTSFNCYAERAREVAQDSRIIIVNHALFFTDLMIKNWGLPGMLGEYDAVIFDEAHTLENIAGDILGGQVTEGSFASLSAQIRRWGNQHADDNGERVNPELFRLSAASTALFAKLTEGRLNTAKVAEANDELTGAFDCLVALRSAMSKTSIEHAPNHDIAFKRRRSLTRQINSLTTRLKQILSAPQEEMVRWVMVERTRRGEERKVIKLAPISVAPTLYSWLFSKTPAVLVSATLIIKRSFDFIVHRLGIPAFEGIDVGSPFDYPHQGRIYVATSLPEPRGADQGAWQAGATNEISSLIRATKGRALVLFTSVAHMKQTAIALKVMNPELDIRSQYEAPTNKLTEWLKDHDVDGHLCGDQRGKVLLATKSFFTGIDIPGEALSLVILTKLPFPRPGEPLTDARCEAIEAAGGSAFAHYTIPVMSLELQQAAGRLLRSTTDRGVVALLDPRLASKGYGRGILADLPPMTRVSSISDIEEFLDSAQTEVVVS